MKDVKCSKLLSNKATSIKIIIIIIIIINNRTHLHPVM